MKHATIIALLMISLVGCGCKVCRCECECAGSALQIKQREPSHHDNLIPDPQLLPDGSTLRILIDDLGPPYTCPICGKTYRSTQKSRTQICGVDHGPGQCCHYGELEVK